MCDNGFCVLTSKIFLVPCLSLSFSDLLTHSPTLHLLTNLWGWCCVNATTLEYYPHFNPNHLRLNMNHGDTCKWLIVKLHYRQSSQLTNDNKANININIFRSSVRWNRFGLLFNVIKVLFWMHKQERQKGKDKIDENNGMDKEKGANW